MSYAVRLHPLVKQDYDEAYEWYEDRQKGLGERFLQAARLKTEEIALHPDAYSSKDKLQFREARTEIFPYIIVYKIDKRKKRFTSVLFIMQKSIRTKNIGKAKIEK